jgi:hypothetical protein
LGDILKKITIGLALTLMVLCDQGHADVLSDFEKIVAKCRDSVSVEYSEVFYNKRIERWVKRTSWPVGDIKYDVKRTESLVSPYVGNLTFTVLLAHDSADSELAANSLQVTQSESLSKTTININFAYQSSAWVAQNGNATYAIRLKQADAFPRGDLLSLSKLELARPYTPQARCL